MNIHYIITKPIITERSMSDAKNGKFTFAAVQNAHKNDIKQAIEKIYSVHVVSISSSMIKGRSKRVGKKRTVKNATHYKKAIVTLKEGEKIDIFEIAA